MDRSSEILKLINECVAELNGQLPPGERLPSGSDVTLIGDGGTLDSLALVTLIASVEQNLSDQLSIDLPLIDEVIGNHHGETTWTISGLLHFILAQQSLE